MRRTRAYRRYKAVTKMLTRVRKWRDWDAKEFATINPGKFRKNNFSCNCSMCKPWKNGHEDNEDMRVKKVGQIEVLEDD